MIIPMDYFRRLEDPKFLAGLKRLEFRERHVFIQWQRGHGPHVFDLPRSDLVRCELCGRLIGKRRVRQASIPMMGKSDTYLLWTTCFGCWSRCEAICRRYYAFLEFRTLINKITKAISDAKKDQDHRRSSNSADPDPGGCDLWDAGTAQGFGRREDRGADQHVAAD